MTNATPQSVTAILEANRQARIASGKQKECPADTVEKAVRNAGVSKTAKAYETKQLEAVSLPVFGRASMAEGPQGTLWVDYAEALGRTSTFRHYYRYDKKTGCDVLALYKGKAYEIKTFWCALTEQACVILD